MRVRIAAQVSGSRDGVMWPKVGEELEVPDDEAEDLIRIGIAKPLDAPEDPVVEENGKLAEPEEETATVPSGNKAVNAKPAPKDGK